jgi:uncharacterized protein with PIN domain
MTEPPRTGTGRLSPVSEIERRRTEAVRTVQARDFVNWETAVRTARREQPELWEDTMTDYMDVEISDLAKRAGITKTEAMRQYRERHPAAVERYRAARNSPTSRPIAKLADYDEAAVLRDSVEASKFDLMKSRGMTRVQALVELRRRDHGVIAKAYNGED